jgi:MOSC domain-containing protein YiiM
MRIDRTKVAQIMAICMPFQSTRLAQMHDVERHDADEAAGRRGNGAGPMGRLVDIAWRAASRAPMQPIAEGIVSTAGGLEGDCKGVKYPRRQITVLALEDWEAAMAEIGAGGLPWTVRRANLLVAGVVLPRAAGGILRIGPVHLEVTAQTYPCARMEAARAGLLRALAKNWRGGVTCRVMEGGRIAVGLPVEVVVRPREVKPHLP